MALLDETRSWFMWKHNGHLPCDGVILDPPPSCAECEQGLCVWEVLRTDMCQLRSEIKEMSSPCEDEIVSHSM